MKPVIAPPKFDEYKEPISDEVIKNFTEFVKITDKDEQKMFVDKLPDNLKIPFDVYVKRQVKVLMYEKSIEKGEDISYVLEQLDDAEQLDGDNSLGKEKLGEQNENDGEDVIQKSVPEDEIQ